MSYLSDIYVTWIFKSQDGDKHRFYCKYLKHGCRAALYLQLTDGSKEYIDKLRSISIVNIKKIKKMTVRLPIFKINSVKICINC
ncbi:hypothetical protein BpHYR1_046887 [Brachionus plicatilis]|uniref:Uncharacterized protein n=1 Tax=Brachionus plicatilis TaxID=10195 RepID=A0A3M7PVL9_BRAPC|nr:hypothetical protein BpHYR1_046887 [Brachionus plicatilis]